MLVATGYPVPPHAAVAAYAALRGGARDDRPPRRGATPWIVDGERCRGVRLASGATDRSMRCCWPPARGRPSLLPSRAAARSRSGARGASRSSWSCRTRRATCSRRRRSAARRSADRSAGASRRRRHVGLQPGHRRRPQRARLHVLRRGAGPAVRWRLARSPAGRASSRTSRSAAVIEVRRCARPQSADGTALHRPRCRRERASPSCAGHGPWGISTGPASAELAVASMLDGVAVPEPLRADRFA